MASKPTFKDCVIVDMALWDYAGSGRIPSGRLAEARTAIKLIKDYFENESLLAKPSMEYGDIATVEYALEELASGVSLDSAKTRGMYMAADQALERIKAAARPQRSQPRQFPEPGHITRVDFETVENLAVLLEMFMTRPYATNMTDDRDKHYAVLSAGYKLEIKLRDIHAAQSETDKDQV